MPRPTKYTPELVAKIIGYLEDGNTRDCAAGSAGVHVSTFCDYLNAYPEFAEECKKAEDRAESTYVGIVRKAADETWQAAAWWLERRRHRNYARQEGPSAFDRWFDGLPEDVKMQLTKNKVEGK